MKVTHWSKALCGGNGFMGGNVGLDGFSSSDDNDGTTASLARFTVGACRSPGLRE
eukprot:CAMPEP_0177794550 /NCGR_PEP_ID=MMETSP0491_2-20121128/25714_1 /TAXON_ID=63592 /ORGANISM="Tetraselmis chuii, Strain PLY429" /LENGTH=54 /DNA_ID=CAMNT_0019317231 /DNA_START=201 /DNA_END=365 /DNA_ORIENTATION=+